MEFTALDPWKLIVLMAAGGVFALAGLWLILRPKTDGHSMVVHVWGMKLEASSAGVLVFLIGTAFFATPLFVRENSASGGAATQQASGDPGSPPAAVVRNAAEESRVQTSEARPQSVQTVSGRAITAVGSEVEPNDNVAEANEIAVGSVISGTVEQGNPDYYSFTFPEDYVGSFAVNLSGDVVWFTLYDDLGARIGNYRDSTRREVRSPRYYVSFGTSDRRADYRLSVASRSE
ncbi:hypothetical protein DKT77_01815 [Meridianimarinicoccus roseus]|uniref:Uncharacterized protein n=1 Tax=Meridianimarinicoccus roseus TaxID=2072018 RepID=A0A2V2LFM3_9RHOB|nr:hypothetical protein [Meridianimarinicoccus roseus]PWR04438.1 hypothetical protein DKT77_01815 [Meridianimarinicoccus roseus]